MCENIPDPLINLHVHVHVVVLLQTVNVFAQWMHAYYYMLHGTQFSS